MGGNPRHLGFGEHPCGHRAQKDCAKRHERAVTKFLHSAWRGLGVRVTSVAVLYQAEKRDVVSLEAAKTAMNPMAVLQWLKAL